MTHRQINRLKRGDRIVVRLYKSKDEYVTVIRYFLEWSPKWEHILYAKDVGLQGYWWSIPHCCVSLPPSCALMDMQRDDT